MSQLPVRLLARRFAGFGVLPLISTISPLIALPVVARLVEPAEWATLLTSQTIGSVAGLIILMGWNSHGQAVAAMAPSAEDRLRLYGVSVRSRARVGALVLPLAVGAAVAINGDTSLATDSLMLLSASWTGFSASWYSTASGNASWIAGYEVVPRLAATLGSIPVVLATGLVWLYPSLLIVASLTGLLAFHWARFGRLWPRHGLVDDLPLDRRELRLGAAYTIIGSSYSSAPLIVGSALGVSGLIGLATADRLYRYALAAVITTGNALHSWVLGDEEGRQARRRSAVLIFAGLGLLGGSALAVAGPVAATILFGKDVAPTGILCWAYAVAFLLLCLSTPIVRFYLVPNRRSAAVMHVTWITSAIGLALMFLLGNVMAANGVAMALAAAEGVALVGVAIADKQVVRRPRHPRGRASERQAS